MFSSLRNSQIVFRSNCTVYFPNSNVCVNFSTFSTIPSRCDMASHWGFDLYFPWASLVAQTVKRLPAMPETRVWSLGWKIPWRRKWQPTPGLLPGKSHGRRSLIGCSPWGCKESDKTEQLHLMTGMGFLGVANSKEPACECWRLKRLWIISLGQKDPLEEGMATHSSILAWRIPRSEESGRLQSIELQRIGHDWSDLAHSD